MQPNEIEQHIQLFLWCERHGLLDCAGDELKAAEALDRQHPMISVLQRRLKVEMQAKKEPVHPADSGPLPPSDEQLERMIRDMPPGTVESFVQVVQPILLNHCPARSVMCSQARDACNSCGRRWAKALAGGSRSEIYTRCCNASTATNRARASC